MVYIKNIQHFKGSDINPCSPNQVYSRILAFLILLQTRTFEGEMSITFSGIAEVYIQIIQTYNKQFYPTLTKLKNFGDQRRLKI